MNRSPDVAALVRCLSAGGVALMGTDTLPGFHARIDAPEAVARIQALKGREAGKPLLVLAASPESVGPWTGGWDERTAAYARRCWPGPFTLVVPALEAAPGAVTGGLGTLAIRVPQPDALRKVLELVGVPVVSTSANLAGERPAEDLEAAAAMFGEAVDLVSEVPWVAPQRTPAAPSTLLDLTGWPPRVLRPGGTPAPSWQDLG